MRYKEFKIIVESSRGLLFRKSGDLFTNIQNPKKTLEFVKAEMFPKQGNRYPDVNVYKKALEDIQKKLINITWTNQTKSNMLAFGIVTLKDPKTQQQIYFGRYFTEIKPDMTGVWKNNDIPGYQLAIKSSLKSRSNLKPNDILIVGQQYRNVTEIVNAVKTQNKAGDEIVEGLAMITKNKLPSFIVDASLEPAIRDDLGEVIAPMALWQGLNDNPEADAARKFLLKTANWNSCSITFAQSKKAGLIDSYLRPQKGVAIGISSKGADIGAKASVSNIYSGIELLRANGQQKVVEEFPKAVKILEVIKQSSAYEGPIKLGIMFGQCSEKDGQLIMDCINKGIKSLPRGPQWKNIQNFMLQLNTNKQNEANYNIGYHALAGLAKLVAGYVNRKILEFSEACITFLNSSPLLQINTYTEKTNNGITVSSFKTIWPPQFKGSIVLNAGKSYYATGAINKFAFSFD
jgi:hypothetical protein